MIIKKGIVFILFFIAVNCLAQVTNSSRVKTIGLSKDTIQLDSLSIVPGSFNIATPDGKQVDTSCYKIIYAEGKLFINKKKIKENTNAPSLILSYKTFPYLFSETVRHKDINRIKPDLFGNANPFSYDIKSDNDDIFRMEGLNKSGSISRGFTVGNNQDMIVNSNLNLQLSGHLSNNIDLVLAATDNNIPIQAEGNTQQLQEFDKVFIQLSNATSKLIAGDFQLVRPTGYFMNFNKKAQGVSFSTAVKTNPDSKIKSKQGVYKTSLSAAVSRGKFGRNQIQGIEGNQGPYRLKGNENEPYIIILSGSEKIYVDGKVVERGQENDYTINYNTGEIIFTAKQIITKDRRIVVEFQYSDKNYARSLLHFGNDYEQNKLKIHLHIYSEQDSKNQPLQQTLSDDDKRLLSKIGDTLSRAVTPSVDSIAWNANEILYYKTDTTIGTHLYKKVFVYSPTKVYVRNGLVDSTHFRVTFSNVGAGKGNYNQIISDANGKVFQWVAPSVNGDTLHGSYEPVIQLITPKKKQMVTAGFEYVFDKNNKLTMEAGVSNNVLNTFSTVDSYDDVGYALKLNYDNVSSISKAASTDSTKHGMKLLSNINYEYVQKYFSPIERYRSIEFERDWNRGTAATLVDQHIIGASVALVKRGLGSVGYKFNTFQEGTYYSANKHNALFTFSKNGLSIMYDGSFLTSSSATNTNFYRHKSSVAQKIKWLSIGLKDEFEQNEFSLKGKKDSLLSNSYKFWEWQAFAQNADTTKNRYGVNYKQRIDYAVKDTLGNASFNQATLARNYGAFLELGKNVNSQLKINASYRKLEILDLKLTNQLPDNSLVARLEYSFKLLKGVISSSSFYEIGSGLEAKKEYSYVQVTAGLGIYQWIDYNGDGIKQLGEFEIAPIPSLAMYIKVFTPTNSYIKTYNNQFSEVLNVKPSVIWATKTGWKKFVARFNNQTSYRVDRKSFDNILERAYNPFLVIKNDTASAAFKTLVTLNSSFRNTLFINQLSPLFGIDLSYQEVRNKSLLTNGYEERMNAYEEARVRWNFIQQMSCNFDGIYGTKANSSQYFSARNYKINYYSMEPKLNYQPTTAFRVSVSFKYSNKENRTETDSLQVKAQLQDYGAELKWNVLNKGSFNMKANYIQISYNAKQPNSALAFEMLDALKPGQNITWGIAYQRNLSNNMQISITYDGRKSAGTNAIHTGGAQIRAYF